MFIDSNVQKCVVDPVAPFYANSHVNPEANWSPGDREPREKRRKIGGVTTETDRRKTGIRNVLDFEQS